MQMQIWWKKYNLDRWWNNDKCLRECKKRHVCKKDYILSPATCSFQNEKCSPRIMDDSAITNHEIIESYDEKTNFDERKQPVKCQITIFYLHSY